jgi:hypothetical protein
VVKIKKPVATLYEVLEISERSAPHEIKKAYRKKVSLYHPDKVACVDDPTLKKRAAREMIKLNLAKETLLDPEKRADYDRKLQNLKTKEVLSADDYSDYVECVEIIEIEWDPDTIAQKFEAEDNKGSVQQPLEHEIIQPRPLKTHDFQEYTIRYLTFCPVCTQENLAGGLVCRFCGGLMVDPDIAHTLGAKLIAKGYPVVYRPTQVQNPFYENLQYPCLVIPQQPVYEPELRESGEVSYEYSAPRQMGYNGAPNVNNNSSRASSQRYLFFCPTCGAENLKGDSICKVCDTNLIEG